MAISIIMNTRFSIFIIIIFAAFACKQKQEKAPQNTFAPKVFEAKGYVVPKDSMASPKVILVDESKLKKIKVGKPKVIPTNTNIHIVGKPKIVIAGKPKIYTPGKDTLLMPKVVSAIDSPFVAGVPEVVIAKDAYIKDKNPQNFSSYSKLQGLKHDIIRCIIQDKIGNLWFGTDGGGVSKYDGKFFTNYTEKEGLSNNKVFSIIQDKSGNIWFGTYGEGVSKYDGKLFTHYTEKEGLINNRVFSILQDKSGNIWFGTEGGVSAYNGKTFTNYTVNEGLINNSVFSIVQDKIGNLWFGTEGGVSKYNGQQSFSSGLNEPASFTNYTEKEGLCNNNVFNIIEDQSGNLWFGTYGGGVSKFCQSEVEGKICYTFTNYTEKEGLSNNFVYTIMQDKGGNLWFGTLGGGVSKLVQNSNVGNPKFNSNESFIHYTEKEGLNNNNVFSIIQDKSGNIWLGTDGGGVSKYDGKSFTHYTEKEGISNNSVFNIIQDCHGNLWFATYGGGVSKYDGKTFTHFSEKEGLSNNIVYCVLQDQRGNLWFGTYDGVFKYDGNGLTRFTKNDGLIDNYVLSMLQDKSGNIWFGTYGGLSKYNGEAIHNGKACFTNYTKKEGLSNNRIYAIYEDKKGCLWFGTNGGITKYEGENLSLKQTRFTQFTEREGLSNASVFSIMQDQSGNFWFGTYGGGIAKYNEQQSSPRSLIESMGIFTYYTEKEGLSNNFVYSILQDKRGNLLFGTRFGLCKLTAKGLASLNEISHMKNPLLKVNDFSYGKSDEVKDIFFKSYTYEDGFLGVGCNRAALFEDNSGTIWIGTNDRLTAYHPEGDEPDTIPPNIQLTTIALYNENIPWINLVTKYKSKKLKENNIAADTSFVLGNGVSVGNFEFDGISKWYGLPENLSLAYSNNYLTFNFIGITTKSPQKVKYQYKLEGIDENWSATTNRTEAPYGNLPQGTYTFKVKAMNSEGYWSNEYSYKFTIRPPWWKTWWFRSMEIGALVLLIIGYIKWRERKLKQDKALLERKVKEQTHELIQINEELTTQRDEIESQKNIIEHKNKNITDSIRYAKRIQQAILPMDEKLDKLLQDYFVFYHPKDIVSGDFYWAENYINSNNETITLFAAIDCTGHGVPGAFMSLLGYNGLSQAIKKNELNKPNDILNFLNNYIREMLRQHKDESNVKDGMDLFLCALNRNTMLLEYAGVHNAAYILRQEEVLTLNAETHQIGDKFTDLFNGFSNHQITLQKGDCLYLFTDGYLDQFGEKDGKKFMSKRFKNLLLEIHLLSMTDQKIKLQKTFEEWKGQEMQIDDVLVMGVRV